MKGTIALRNTSAVDADVKLPQSADFLSPSAITFNPLLGSG